MLGDAQIRNQRQLPPISGSSRRPQSVCDLSRREPEQTGLISSSVANSNPDLRKHTNRPKWFGSRVFLQRQHSMDEDHLHSEEATESMRQLQQKRDDKMAYTRENSKQTQLEFEWQCLQEKQDVKRTFMNKLDELKQNRLQELGRQKICRIIDYYELHRHWLADQHKHQLSHHQAIAQELLKNLETTHTLELQSAKRRAVSSAKNQKHIERICAKLDAKAAKRAQEGHMLATKSLFVAKPADCDGSLNRNATSAIQPISEYDFSVGTLNSTARQLDRPVEQSTLPLPASSEGLATNGHAKSARDGTSSVQARQLQPEGSMNQRPQSMLSLANSQSHISQTSERYQHLLLSEIYKHQSQQWAEEIQRHKLQSDSLIRAQAEQRRTLLDEETNELKNMQLEQKYKAMQLSLTLEAAKKFVEREFEQEQSRLREKYCGPKHGIDSSSTRAVRRLTLESPSLPRLDEHFSAQSNLVSQTANNFNDTNRPLPLLTTTTTADGNAVNSTFSTPNDCAPSVSRSREIASKVEQPCAANASRRPHVQVIRERAAK